ncbi:MAG: hypothetical protein WB710_20110 [Stellaceae bacterium]
MATANIADRAGLERIYPAEAFASDAAQNDDLATGLERGVRVLSAPEAGGAFGVERAARQVGEAQSPSFLVPRRRRAAAADPDPQAGYAEFLTDIVEAARRFGFEAKDTPGRGDPRIRGLRQ